MNNLLQLKGSLDSQGIRQAYGARNLPSKQSLPSSRLDSLITDLKSVKEYWKDNQILENVFVTVRCNRVLAKSNRLNVLLSYAGHKPNDSIRGVRFSDDKSPKHIFTYYVPSDCIDLTIDKLIKTRDYINAKFNGVITRDTISKLTNKELPYDNAAIRLSVLVNVIVDAFYVDKFEVYIPEINTAEASLVTIYETGISKDVLFEKLGIPLKELKAIDDFTYLFSVDQLEIINQKAPYLVAMAVKDMNEYSFEDIHDDDPRTVTIPEPSDEPVIGVLDTPFSTKEYFSAWVDYEEMIPNEIINPEDYEHGTQVSSIIVDGPTINPDLDDGCGRFRVKHFGIAVSSNFSTFTILQSIRKAVKNNPDIKVWNLSLGSRFEIDRNFISPEAAELDNIQNEYDVIFVVAGTNRLPGQPEGMRIGSPADSLNSVVVNSVNKRGEPAVYTRVGPVLSFFHKPDVSYYGGDQGEPMKLCSVGGEYKSSGTSYAAPWVARKLAFMIYKLGLNRELAKALLIDSAAGWQRKDDISCSIGYGVVPIRIEDVVGSKDDEIRFVITGQVDEYETFSYRLPVPQDNGKQPYYARATLCYFPATKRYQGVDYTTTELDLRFGRVEEKKGKTTIKSLPSYNKDDYEERSFYEKDARALYRKWDNVKVVSDTLKARSIPRKIYGAGNWGLSLKTYERLQDKYGRGMTFGVVITLKEMNGVNRINDFIKQCEFRGWLVNTIDIENQIDIYNKAEEDIVWD